MNNLSLLDQIVSVEELVRNYRTVFDKVKKTRKPMIVLRRNIPDIALVDVGYFRDVEQKLKELEEEKVLKIVEEGRKEFKKGKAKVLKSITSLI